MHSIKYLYVQYIYIYIFNCFCILTPSPPYHFPMNPLLHSDCSAGTAFKTNPMDAASTPLIKSWSETRTWKQEDIYYQSKQSTMLWTNHWKVSCKPSNCLIFSCSHGMFSSYNIFQTNVKQNWNLSFVGTAKANQVCYGHNNIWSFHALQNFRESNHLHVAILFFTLYDLQRRNSFRLLIYNVQSILFKYFLYPSTCFVATRVVFLKTLGCMRGPLNARNPSFAFSIQHWCLNRSFCAWSLHHLGVQLYQSAA